MHIVRKLWPGYVALYRNKAGDEILIKSLDPPPEVRVLKGQGGLRKYKRVKHKEFLQEVLIVAKSTKKASKKSTVTDDELDELETVDDLEDLEDVDLEEEEEEEEDDEEEDEDDEEEPEDEEDEEDDDEDDDEEEEEPTPKKSSKKASKSSKKSSRAAQNGKVGTQEIAKASGVDSRRVRMVLRKHKVKKDPETNRYEWSSLNHKTVQKILKWLEDGEADEIVKESLDKLKAKKEAEKKDAKKTTKKAKKAPAKKKKKVVEEDEDDE